MEIEKVEKEVLLSEENENEEVVAEEENEEVNENEITEEDTEVTE